MIYIIKSLLLALLMSSAICHADPSINARRIGETIRFGFEYPEVAIGCGLCGQGCSDCQFDHTINVPFGATAASCGATQFTLSWDWPVVTVSGGCNSPKRYRYSFVYRGIRISDGQTVFAGETSAMLFDVEVWSEQELIRLEVAARVMDMVTDSEIQSRWALSDSVNDAYPAPWVVSINLHDPHNVTIRKR